MRFVPPVKRRGDVSTGRCSHRPKVMHLSRNPPRLSSMLTRFRDRVARVVGPVSLGICAMMLSGGVAGAQGVAPAARPHVILIMTDQQKASATSLHGNRFVQTPTLERLATEGVT